jgi:S1-C subfamily serine protease
MKNTLILVFIAIFFTQMKAQNEKPSKIYTADELATTVVNLRKEVSPGQEKTGTGSFVHKGNDIYIVTATHVSKSMDSSAYVIIQGKNNTPLKIQLNKLANPVKWIEHPEADLSIIKLNPEKEIVNHLQGRFINYEIIDTSRTPVSRNIQVTIIGFPLGLGAKGHFSPLTYRTFPSSGFISLLRADSKTQQTFIIMENPSIGGYSGGPVYDLSIIESGNLTMTGSGTKLLGFIHGTISDETGGKLSAITPAYYLSDLMK